MVVAVSVYATVLKVVKSINCAPTRIGTLSDVNEPLWPFNTYLFILELIEEIFILLTAIK